MTIDLHAHLARDQPGAPPFMRALFDVEGYLVNQESSGVELTVLAYAPADVVGAPEELDEAKGEHEFLGGLIEAHPGRLSAFAGVDPLGGEAWLAEGERALDAGFSGLCFPTSVAGRYLDQPEAADAWALANERKAVVFLHPSVTPIGPDLTGDGVLAAWIGRPMDTAICLSRMLIADTLGAYPDVRVVVAHGGGVLPMLLGRLDRVQEGFQRRAKMMKGGGGGPPGGGPPGGGGPKGPPKSDVPEGAKLTPSLEGALPSERIGQLYLDTATYHQAAVHAAIAAVGIDRVVFGSDHPPALDSPRPVVELIEGLGLDPADTDKILRENARRLLPS